MRLSIEPLYMYLANSYRVEGYVRGMKVSALGLILVLGLIITAFPLLLWWSICTAVLAQVNNNNTG